MNFTVEFSEKAKKNIEKLDIYTAKLIIAWIRKNLENCKNPRAFGKSLRANHNGEWRYRMGDYRILAEIQDNKLIILVLEIGHRKEIYN